MGCEKHKFIESSMVSHMIVNCIICGELADIYGNTVEVGDWLPECSGADYWNGSFKCAYGYTAKCKDCTVGSTTPPTSE